MSKGLSLYHMINLLTMKIDFRYLILVFCFAFLNQIGAQSILTKQKPLPCLDKKFTIVAHVVQDTFMAPGIMDQEIFAAVDTLNKDFAPICVSFEVCEINVIENFQYNELEDGELDELIDLEHKQRRINVFFVSSYANGELCGFADEGGITNVDTTAIAIYKGGCMEPQRRSLSHLMGRYFGLLRTFEGNGAELVDMSNCETEGDLICDTPADPYIETDPLENYVDVGLGCRFINMRVDANGSFYDPDVGNIMSYYQGECLCGFTYGQYLRMAGTYLGNPDMW